MSQQINLYNPILLRQKKYFSAATMAQALGILLLGMLAFYAYARYQVANLQTATEISAKRLESAQARVGRLAQQFNPRSKSAALEQRIRKAETELKTMVQAQQALQQSGLLDSRGFSPYFQALARQIVDGLWLTQFSIGSGEMRISGRALQAQLVPTYIRRLSAEPALQGRQFSMLEMRQPEAAKGPEQKSADTPHYIEFTLQSALPADKAGAKP